MKRSSLFVGTVVFKNDRILMVRQSPGHSLEGQWTIPWGAVEVGETAASAAVRETMEEGGILAEVESLIGIQELPPPQDGCVAVIFRCKHISGDPKPRDRETDAAEYFGPTELDLLEEPLEPLSNWLVRRAFARDLAEILSRSDNPLQTHGSFI